MGLALCAQPCPGNPDKGKQCLWRTTRWACLHSHSGRQGHSLVNLHSGKQDTLGPEGRLCELCVKEREGLSWLQNLDFLGGRQWVCLCGWEAAGG